MSPNHSSSAANHRNNVYTYTNLSPPLPTLYNSSSPPKSANMSRLIHTPQGYDLTNNPPSLPWTFLSSKNLTRLTVEISRLSPLELFSGLKNDVRLLLEYEPVDQYPAISLRMEYDTDIDDPDLDPNGFQEAYLCAKPCLTTGPGLTTFCTLQLDIDEGWTLAGVFDALLASNVQHFDFQMIFFLCHGQRDFL